MIYLPVVYTTTAYATIYYGGSGDQKLFVTTTITVNDIAFE